MLGGLGGRRRTLLSMGIDFTPDASTAVWMVRKLFFFRQPSTIKIHSSLLLPIFTHMCRRRERVVLLHILKQIKPLRIQKLHRIFSGV